MIEARIGGGGKSSLRFVAATPNDRTTFIDQCLAELDEPVMFLEVKRDDPRSWQEWKDDIGFFEHIRVGIAGDLAAAEYTRGGFRSGKLVLDEVRATHNPAPPADQPLVTYDAAVSTYFPPEIVISREQVRRLMVHYATTGEWLDDVPSRNHEYLVR